MACAAAAAAATTLAYHADNSAPDGIRVTPTAACIKGAVSVADTAPPNKIGARLDLYDDTATAVSYFSTRQATHRVIAKSATFTTAVADVVQSWSSLDSDTSLDTECGPCARTTSQAAVRMAKIASPRSSRPTPTRTMEGRGSAPAPTSKLLPSPPWTPSPMPAEYQLRKTAV